MGTTIDAHCYGCGYDVNVMVGGGMRNFQTFSGWPALCATCGEVTTVNLFDQPPACLACKATGVRFFEDEPSPAEIDAWYSLRRAKPPPSPALLRTLAALGLKPETPKPDPRNDPVVTTSGVHKLTKAAFRCPKCQMHELRLGTEHTSGKILWD